MFCFGVIFVNNCCRFSLLTFYRSKNEIGEEKDVWLKVVDKYFIITVLFTPYKDGLEWQSNNK